MVNGYKGCDTGWRCNECKRQFPYKVTADLCCTKKGCSFMETPNAPITNICGESIEDGKFWFCKECREKE